MQISLVPLNDGQPFVVTLPLTLVGSKEGCDFQVEGKGVAPLCCVLALTDGLLLVRDLETGRIRVNDPRVRRAALLPNDRLTIASRAFRVHYDQGGNGASTDRLRRTGAGRGGDRRISLVPLEGGQPLVVTYPVTLVGSKEGCDLRVEGEGVAPLCCVLALTDGLLLVRDLETGSICFSGEPVRQAALLPNDGLTIAGRTFRVHYEVGNG
jgi:hypothetical protein